MFESPCYALSDALHKNVRDNRKRLEGKLLTIIEAVARDDQQREALKSIIRNTVWETELVEIDDILKQWTKKFIKEIKNIKLEEDGFLGIDLRSGGTVSCNYFPGK